VKGEGIIRDQARSSHARAEIAEAALGGAEGNLNINAQVLHWQAVLNWFLREAGSGGL
jgi:hypothetical protein